MHGESPGQMHLVPVKADGSPTICRTMQRFFMCHADADAGLSERKLLCADRYAFCSRQADRDAVLSFCLKVLLYERPLPAPQPSAAAAVGLMAMLGQQPSRAAGSGGAGGLPLAGQPSMAATASATAGSSAQSGPPPGLSLSDVAAVVGKAAPTGKACLIMSFMSCTWLAVLPIGCLRIPALGQF